MDVDRDTWTHVLLMDVDRDAEILKTGEAGRRNMKQSSQDKGRGEGRNSSARWHRLLCN